VVMSEIKQEVREFYNQVGWQEVSEGVYQNARYEDLRPVSRAYIHRCHMRVAEHLNPQGRYLLDAGCGPIQYPEYLEYSRGYARRVCADISIVALQEARRRIGEHGLFVVADIANLPFKPEVFDGIVSLHTIHHLPLPEHEQAYGELYRVLAGSARAVVVNGWESALMALFKQPIRWVERLYAWKQRRSARSQTLDALNMDPMVGAVAEKNPGSLGQSDGPQGTFVHKHNARWLKDHIGQTMPVEIRVWRSVSVRFLRTFIHDGKGGRQLLRLLVWLEERFPRFFGEKGVYPLIVIRKG
jgi:ubiquinone/menaquinone biosynthesis C-methylase UbiE